MVHAEDADVREDGDEKMNAASTVFFNECREPIINKSTIMTFCFCIFKLVFIYRPPENTADADAYDGAGG